VRFQVLTAASMKIRAFSDVALCSLGVDRRFRGAYCLHHHGDDDGVNNKPLKRLSTPRLHRTTSEKTNLQDYEIIILSVCLSILSLNRLVDFMRFCREVMPFKGTLM
jgi:hypothetical protein